MSRRVEFSVIALVALLAACYAPPPQINAALLGILSGIAMGGVLLWRTTREREPAGVAEDKLWRISQAVKLQRQNDLAGLQQFYDYVKGVVEHQDSD